MQEMLALGAPVLPSGYFYRIGIASFGYHKISIRKSCRFGSKKIVSVIFHVDNYAEKSCEKLIKTSAEKALDDWTFMQDSKARYCAMDKWMGNHK